MEENKKNESVIEEIKPQITAVKSAEEDKDHAPFAIKLLSFLLPPLGAIFYAIWRKDFPTSAAECTGYAWVGVFVMIPVSIIIAWLMSVV